MAVLALTGVVSDASGTQVPTPQRISWIRAEGGTINITVTKSDGSAYNLAGATLAIAMRPKNTVGSASGLPLFARQAIPVDAAAGAAKFVLVSGDTSDLSERRTYRYDVQLVDSGGLRWQIIPESDFRLEAIVSMPGDPVSAP